MGRRGDHTKEEIREMALAAAEKLVALEGFQSLSTRKVAKSIGYTVGSLYVVFQNLDDLILNVNARTLDKLSLNLLERGKSEADPLAALLAMASQYYEFVVDNSNLVGMIYDHRMPTKDSLPDWYQPKVAGIFNEIEQLVGKVLIGKDASITACAARVLWSGVHGICILDITDNLTIANAGSSRELLESFVTNYIAGIMK